MPRYVLLLLLSLVLVACKSEAPPAPPAVATEADRAPLLLDKEATVAGVAFALPDGEGENFLSHFSSASCAERIRYLLEKSASASVPLDEMPLPRRRCVAARVMIGCLQQDQRSTADKGDDASHFKLALDVAEQSKSGACSTIKLTTAETALVQAIQSKVPEFVPVE
ncbi:MAG TPA: hypothetical protein VEY88_26360 [Archangium sp.]|nr:hypothetical protein [Archangium sp.]